MPDELSRKLHAFEADHRWITENFETLSEQYVDLWIAVKNCRVIGSDPDPATQRSKLSDPADTCVEFITREPLEMVL